jgi:hypothetical protein
MVTEDTVGRVLPVNDPATLRELAAVIERRRPRPHVRLSAERLDELADMALHGTRPTVGWWRRALGPDTQLAERMAAARADLARLRAEWGRDDGP